MRQLPILGIGGVDATSLIEQNVRRLCGQGLRLAVVMKRAGRDAGEMDAGGERMIAAGADLVARGEGETMLVQRQSALALDSELADLADRYDAVLVAVGQQTSVATVWLAGDDRPAPAGMKVVATVTGDDDRERRLATVIDDFLARQWRRSPVLAAILIGGKSSRMGRPKHLLVKDGRTWLQRTAGLLAQVADQVVVVGEGEMGACQLPRLIDAPGCAGPVSGLLAALRWQPRATVLLSACDLPDLSVAALRWLLAQRTLGTRAVIPRVDDYHQPLLALYDFRIRDHVEAMTAQGLSRLSHLVKAPGVRVVTPPPELRGAWRNVNDPQSLDKGRGQEG